MARPLYGFALALAGVLLLGATDAAAASRYAAPGGSGPQPCAQADPCSLFAAAGASQGAQQGDEVIVEPGRYSAGAGELGPGNGLVVEAGIVLHGVFGAPRPLLVLDRAPVGSSSPGLSLHSDRLAHLELESEVAMSDIGLFKGTLGLNVVEDVVARSSTPGAVTCAVEDGVLRSSACLSSGAGATAAGLTDAAAERGGTVALRHLTASSTGAGSFGLAYFLTTAPSKAAPTISVSGLGLIAKGTAADVAANGFGGGQANGAKVRIELSASDFSTASREAGANGSAEVTAPGSGSNILAPPLLAADGYHELPASPTVDKGGVDNVSSAGDIDEELRVMGNAADIGGDELTATELALTCSPSTIRVNARAHCRAKVTSVGLGTPAGKVRFLSATGGAFPGGATCVLAVVGPGEAACGVVYRPGAKSRGTNRISAVYASDATFAPALDSTLVQVGKLRGRGERPPNTRFKRKPPRRTSRPRAIFTFAADRPAHFFCKLDHRRPRPCRSPFRVRVKPGRHRLQVGAVSSTGLIERKPASFAWTVRTR